MLPPTEVGGRGHKNIVLIEIIGKIALEMAVNSHIEILFAIIVLNYKAYLIR